MKNTDLIIILGAPASGKTTLARRLSPDLSLPCLCKDDVKEALFDVLGVTDREGSRRLSDASFAALLKLAATLLAAGQSCMLEGNWRPEHAPAIAALLASHGARAAQVSSTASAAEIERRFAARVRHAGHLDAGAVRPNPAGGKPPPVFLGIEGPRWPYDSSDPRDYERLLGRLKMWRL
jgi:predicted kinase